MNSKLKTSTLILFLVFLFVPAAFSAPVTITNYSFETLGGSLWEDPIMGDWSYGEIPGWTTDSESVFFGGSWAPKFGYTQPIPDGNNIGWLLDGAITQTITGEESKVEAGDTYTLTVHIGNRADYSFPSYSVEILGGETVLASDGYSLEGEGLKPEEGGFLPLTVKYFVADDDPTIGSDLGIRISFLGGGAQLNFDNVRFENHEGAKTASVPEPATMILLGLGLASVAAFGRKMFR